MVILVLLKLFGTLPIIVGVILTWRNGDYGLAFFMWGIYVLVSYLIWFTVTQLEEKKK